MALAVVLSRRACAHAPLLELHHGAHVEKYGSKIGTSASCLLTSGECLKVRWRRFSQGHLNTDGITQNEFSLCTMRKSHRCAFLL